MLREAYDKSIRDLCAMTQMKVVKVLAQRLDDTCAGVGDLVALCESQTSQSWGSGDDSKKSLIGDVGTGGKVEDSKLVKAVGLRTDG